MKKTRLKTLLKIAFSGDPLGAIRFWWREIRGSRSPVSVRVFGETVILRPGTPDAKVATNNLGKEFQALSFLLPNPDAVIVDCGAYIGTASIALRRLFPEVRIYSIEPSMDNFKILEENTSRFERITPIRAALCADSNGGLIKLRSRPTGEWGYTIVKTDEKMSQKEEEVPTISLGEILEMSGADRFLVVKMDIEGAELEPLMRHEEWLPNTDALAIELHERIAPGIEEAFKTASKDRKNLSLGTDKFLSLSSRVSNRF